ncbi:MAG: hypothetical protein KY458_13635 [Actinobacteria bacterium]|nr:hypothetical protein [Actinomycetota bacterium]
MVSYEVKRTANTPDRDWWTSATRDLVGTPLEDLAAGRRTISDSWLH